MHTLRRFVAATVTLTQASTLAFIGALGASSPAQAVVQDLKIVNEAGEPVTGQTITITFPDGMTTAEVEDDDDDGVIYFDFQDDGIYQLSWDGGSMSYEFQGGEAGSRSSQGLIVGGLIGLGILAAAASGSDSSSSSAPAEEPQSEDPPEDPGTDDPGTEDPGSEDPGTDDPGTEDPGSGDPDTEDPGTEDPGTEDPGTEDPGTDDPGAEDPGTEEPPGGGGDSDMLMPGAYSGLFDMVMEVSNPDMHPVSGFSDAQYAITVGSNGTITIAISNSQAQVVATLTGQITAANMDGGYAFTATGDGTYFGFEDMFRMDGLIFLTSGGTWSGEVSVGEAGNLPDSNGDGSNQPLILTWDGPFQVQ